MNDRRPEGPDVTHPRVRTTVAPVRDDQWLAPGSATGFEGVDLVTGLHDRRFFDEWLHSELTAAARRGTTLSLLLLAVDHFAMTNDQRGNAVGDVVLKLVAGSIQTLLLPETMLARFGEAQFALVARGTSPRNLEIQGNRICHRVAGLSLERTIPTFPITVSGGLASTQLMAGVEITDALLAAARGALHEAERLGGNCICIAADPGVRT
jgi:diguanylate cyclase (GGDEF)-like protein